MRYSVKTTYSIDNKKRYKTGHIISFIGFLFFLVGLYLIMNLVLGSEGSFWGSDDYFAKIYDLLEGIVPYENLSSMVTIVFFSPLGFGFLLILLGAIVRRTAMTKLSENWTRL